VSRRIRLSLVVSACALAAAGVAVGGALLQGDDGSAAPAREAAGEPPPLELELLTGEPGVEMLLAAERAYDAGRLDDAAARFERALESDPDSPAAAVGAALAAWPDGTVASLEALAAAEPDSALVRLHLGLALAESGDIEAAQGEWRLAVARDPDSPSAVRADSLLHPDVAPGLPFFLPSTPISERIRQLPPLEQLAALEARAERGGATDQLLLGSLLQRLGRPVSAQQAFDRAAELEPGSVEARAAAAVGRFDKDDPSRAFSRLGPLSREHPQSSVVRFHLGLMLLWIRGVEEAERQLRQAVEADASSIYAREARKLLATLAQS
jgi:tetratricopeptide (TPR) repeat protein